ncbi:MAG: ClC family H(+)/Cl(-) exchange transporter [Eubacteriales bacterium]|nr:ClC family H(+)/Cl(-) exchange transporter [Eubacteriales bacterium]
MTKNKSSEKFMIGYIRTTLLPILVFGGVSGVLSGLVVWGFKWCASYLENESVQIYKWFRLNPTFIPLLFAGLIVLALLSAIMNKAIPELRTNSIANAEGAMRGMKRYNWVRTIFGTMASSFLSYTGGLTFGAEGPSIQLGSTIGQATNDFGHFIEKGSPAWERYNVTGGAAAGFAVAFGAPLSGILYTLEEAHKRLSPMLLMTAASSVFFATIVSQSLGDLVGQSDYFLQIGTLTLMPYKNYWTLLLIGIACGCLAALFNTLFAKTGELVREKLIKIPTWVRIVFIFLLTGVVGLVFVDAIGGGHRIIQGILNLDFTWQVLLVMFFVRFALLIITPNSGAMGGMFVPVLTIGALVGGLLGKAFIAMGLSSEFYQTIVLITMTTFMGATMRAPLTAIVLVVEMTNNYFSSFLSTGITVMIAYLIVEALRIEPLYEKSLMDSFKNAYKGKHRKVYEFSVVVEKGSFVEGRSVKDILWPYGCTIVNVIKVDDEGNKVDTTDKAGDRVIRAGQTYTVKAFVYDELKAIEEMEYLTKNYSVRETTELLKRKGFGGILLRRKAKTNKKESDGANGAVDSAFDAERKNFETQEMPADNKEIREQVDNDEKVDSDKQ